MAFTYVNDTIPQPGYRNNELDIRLLGLAGMNPYCYHNSSPRMAMFKKHIAQYLPIKHPTKARLVSGMDRELGKYTYNVSFPNNSYIIAVIPKYPQSIRMPNTFANPMVTVIFENSDSDDLEIGVIDIPIYTSLHQKFGIDYKFNRDVYDNITAGSRIPAGTVVAKSPNLDVDDDYCYGIETNICYTTAPGGIEDGIVVSEEWLERAKFNVYEERTFKFGRNQLPLNLYGNDDYYKIFPDIGEFVREDGLLVSLRDFNIDTAPATMSKRKLREADSFDSSIYVEPGSQVIDVKVRRGSTKESKLLSGMDDQCDKYYAAAMKYYRRVYAQYKQLESELGKGLVISKEFKRLIVEAIAMIDADDRKNNLKLVEKKTKLDVWNVTIKLRREVTPIVGSKNTDRNGSKGVICTVKPRSEMPTDCEGNVADMVMDAVSVIKRTNLGRLFEQFVNACGSSLTKRIKRMCEDGQERSYEEAWQLLLGFYKIVSPPMYELLGRKQIDPMNHLKKVMQNGIYVWVPTNNPIDNIDMVRLLKQYYPPAYGPITFVENGKRVTTHNPILIGSVYIFSLDKIADMTTAVSSAKLQHHGLPAKLTTRSKNTEPFRNSPTRTFGEAEVRLYTAIAGGEAVADVLDQTTNIGVHREICKGILEAEQPTNVYSYVDRKKFPIGYGSVVNTTRHVFRCFGIEFVRS